MHNTPTPTPTHQRETGAKRKARVVPRAQQARFARLTEELKQQWAKERKQNGQLIAMAQRDREIRERPATKKDAHQAPRLTYNTRNHLNAEALRACPGGGRNTTISLMKMIEAEETGCRLARPAELQRLVHSARNANTTCGNYAATKLH